MKRRRILLARRPEGELRDADLEIVDEPVPPLEAGQILVGNRFLSMDPAIRGWMSNTDSYIDPIAIGDVVRGAAVGNVVASENEKWAVGDLIVAIAGWETHSVMGPRVMGQKIPPGLPLSASTYLGVLGGAGLTAYIGLLEVGALAEGESLLISAAGGGVGSIVGQIGKIKGCHVVGIAGTDEKCAWLTDEMGFDGAVNYRAGSLLTHLRAACPNGVDVFFDNVGGEILDTALRLINVRARVVLCGAISQINAATPPPGPSNYIRLRTKRARMEGFITLDHARNWGAASAQLAQWVLGGELKYRETIIDGIDQTPAAFNMLFSGGNIGKLIVAL